MAKETRKTKDGRYVLRPGEYERTKKAGFEFKYRDEFGHQHTLGAMTLKELREKEKAITKDKIDGISTSKQRQTLNDFYRLWKHQSRGLKDNTYSNYVWMYDRFVSQTLGTMKVKDIKESDITEFYNSLLDEGIAINTMDGVQTILHQVLDLAFKDDAVRRNVSDNALKKMKKNHPREKKKALTPEELKRFRECIADSVWYPVFEVMSWTGMRVGEISGLTWDDIDYEKGVIHINKTLVYYKDQNTGKMERRLNATKTPASFRDLPLNQHIIDALAYQKEKCPDCKDVIDGVDGFIFATRFHGTQHQGTLNKALRRIVKDANAEKDATVLLPYFSCHTMRRTYATNLARAGVNVAVTMSLMGHTDMETTLNIYTDVQNDMKAKGDAQLQAWLNGQNTAEDNALHDEYEELRQMAGDVVKVVKAAHEDMKNMEGAVSAHNVEKMKNLGISYDDL